MAQNHWKHIWPSSKVLADFVVQNASMFSGKTVLELGSGATGVGGLAAAKVGAKKVILTDLENAQNLLKTNVEKNNCGNQCVVEILDWSDQNSTKKILDSYQIDIVIASDVFYDPSVFIPVVETFKLIISTYPHAYMMFVYQERDDNWNISELLSESGLEAHLLREIESSGHTIQLGVISTMENPDDLMFGGIEGGASHSKLVLVDSTGEKRIWATSSGTNYYLDGVEKVGDHVAEWIRKTATDNGVGLPLAALGMGLSGAEDESINAKFVDYLRQNHGDVAKNFHLSSDAVCAVAASFDKSGVVLIAGTGSSCRMLDSGGQVFGVGGWGHAIGDEGSGFWITNRAIKVLFDHEDGFQLSSHPVCKIEKLLFEHFNLKDKVEILDFLYENFDKARVATFTEVLAKNSEDPAIAAVFHEAGQLLGRHVVAVSKRLKEKEKETVEVVLVGSVFKSWKLLREGFIEVFKNSGIETVNLYLPSEEPAIGAAVLAARRRQSEIPHAKNKTLIESIQTSSN